MSDALVIEHSISRIADLNRTLLGYRFFLATIVGAFFASLGFAANITTSVTFLESMDAYVIVLFLLLIISLSTISIIAFFDFLHQEFIEDCVSTVIYIEEQSGRKGPRALFNKRPSHISSVRLNTTIVLLYAVPIVCLFGSVFLLCGLVFQERSLASPSQLHEIMMDVCMNGQALTLLESDAGVLLTDKCESYLLTKSFAPGFRVVMPIGFVLSLGFFSFFSLFSLHRIIKRSTSSLFNFWPINRKFIWQDKYDYRFNSLVRWFAVVIWILFFSLCVSEKAREYFIVFVFDGVIVKDTSPKIEQIGALIHMPGKPM